jgi:hypothetical protein
MRGAPAKAIQELEGHQDLTTTQRYMHLTPAALESAIGCSTETEPSWMLEKSWRRLRRERKRPGKQGQFGCGGGI